MDILSGADPLKREGVGANLAKYCILHCYASTIILAKRGR